VERTVALVLAVDPGSGFDGSKYLARVGSRRLLESVVDDVRTWPVDDVVVVLGPDDEEVARSADLGDALLVLDPEWAEGLAASLRAGLDTIARAGGVERVVLGYGDQPAVGAAIPAELVEAQSAPGCIAAVPKYRYARGWPIVLGRDLWERLLGLEGDVDVLAFLETHPDGVCEVWFDRLPPARVMWASDLPARPPG
jgi:CTP:molybdopterin cytidylyltransferase MocA